MHKTTKQPKLGFNSYFFVFVSLGGWVSDVFHKKWFGDGDLTLSSMLIFPFAKDVKTYLFGAISICSTLSDVVAGQRSTTDH